MDLEKIGKFIAVRRKEKGMTQEQLGEQLGVTHKAVSKWENGRNLPDPSLYRPLCAALGITLTEFFNGELIAREELVERSDAVICEIAGERKKNSIVMAVSYCFLLTGAGLIFLQVLGDFGKNAALALTAAGFGIFLFGIALRIGQWGRMQDKKIENGGMGICSGLTLIFTGLKLTGKIDWPWILVISPLWIGILAVLAAAAIVLAVCAWRERSGKQEIKS